MPRDDFERYRKRLEKQLRADIVPRRSTLIEALNTLERNGVLVRTREAAGRQPARFGKAPG